MFELTAILCILTFFLFIAKLNGIKSILCKWRHTSFKKHWNLKNEFWTNFEATAGGLFVESIPWLGVQIRSFLIISKNLLISYETEVDDFWPFPIWRHDLMLTTCDVTVIQIERCQYSRPTNALLSPLKGGHSNNTWHFYVWF